MQPEGLALSEATTPALQELKDHSSQTELKPFFGLGNILQRFAQNFSRMEAQVDKKL